MQNIFLLFFLIYSSINLQARQTITLSTGEWAPYTSQTDPQGRIAQIIVTEAFNLENVSVKYSYFPWKEALKKTKELQVDGSIPWYKTKQRQEEFYYSKRAIVRSKIVFFHLKSLDFKWKNYNDLKQYTIGATIGYKSTKLLENEKLKVLLFQSELDNFKEIQKKAVDITASSVLVGYDIINKNFNKKDAKLFTHHDNPIYPETGAHLLISKKHVNAKELITQFDSGLKKLIKSGRYEQIIKNFMTKK